MRFSTTAMAPISRSALVATTLPRSERAASGRMTQSAINETSANAASCPHSGTAASASSSETSAPKANQTLMSALGVASSMMSAAANTTVHTQIMTHPLLHP